MSDERKRLIRRLEDAELYDAGETKSYLPIAAAAMLRADGERIKALEEALRAWIAAYDNHRPEREQIIRDAARALLEGNDG